MCRLPRLYSAPRDTETQSYEGVESPREADAERRTLIP